MCLDVSQDVAEFKLFGKAISGRDVTDTQARCVGVHVRGPYHLPI